jgi:tetratricopeptide (TPR) repeat protein
MRIVVCGRPNPGLPGDVPADHPLRDPSVLRSLEVSPHAKVAEDRMLLELDRLLHAGPEERDLLGQLTAARGGLTTADLAELTDQSVGQVRRRLRGVAARTFDTRGGHWRRDVKVYLLGHEDLQAIATDELGEHQLEQYRRRLHGWAERYLALGWPAQTPEYLLRGYHRLLAATDDLPRMITLATEPARHNRMLDLSGSDTAALTEIATTQDQILSRDSADLLALLRLAIHRDHLLARNRDIPEVLPAHWARRGYVDRAEALANSIIDPVARCSTISRVAVMAASTGSPQQARSLIDRTETAARTIIDPSKRAEALMHIVTAVAEMGDMERAEALVRAFIDPEQQALALTRLAGAVTRLGDIERVRALIDRAETIARSEIEPGGRQTVALMKVAQALAQSGDLARAENIVHSLDAGQQLWALRQLVPAATASRNWERAETIARDITDPRKQAGVLSRIAVTAARDGDVERAHALIDHAEATIRAIADVGEWAAALADLATAAAQTGDTDHAISLIADAEAVINKIAMPHQQRRALQSMVTAIAESGDLTRAEAVARTITDPTSRTPVLGKVAVALARAGHLERAEALTHEFTDFPERPHPRTLVAEAIAEAGDLVRAEAVARNITAPHGRQSVLGQVAVVLAQNGDVERAEALARSDIVASWQWPLAEIAAVLAQNGDLERAEAIARELTDHDKRAWALGDVAAALVQNGHLHQAHQLLDQAQAAASHILDGELKAQTFIQLAEVAAEMDDPSRLRSLIDDVASIAQQLSADGRALTLTWVVETHLQIGNLEQADSTARDITDPTSRLWMLARLVDAFAEAGEPVRVRALIDHAEGLARSHADPDERAFALTRVAKALVQVDDLDRARSLIDDAETLAHNIPKPEIREWALEQVAEALVWVGDLEQAKTIASRLTTPARQDQVLTHVAMALAEDGDLEHAKNTAHCITDPDRQAEAMLELARSLSPVDSEVTDVEHCNLPTARAGDCDSTDRRWSLMAESLRLTKWEDCLDILTELVPTAAAIALRELETIGWLALDDS